MLYKILWWQCQIVLFVFDFMLLCVWTVDILDCFGLKFNFRICRIASWFEFMFHCTYYVNCLFVMVILIFSVFVVFRGKFNANRSNKRNWWWLWVNTGKMVTLEVESCVHQEDGHPWSRKPLILSIMWRWKSSTKRVFHLICIA